MQYNVKHAKVVNVFAFDSDGYTLPVLGVKFDGYDTSIIKMVGRCIIVVGKGTTRVTAHWQGFSCEFVVSTED